MGKKIALIIAVVAVAIALTGNSVGWLNRTELTREEYFASFAEDYREQGKADNGETRIVVSAPDFSRLQGETDESLAQMSVNDLQVLVSRHQALKKDYEFTVDEVSKETVQEGFFACLSLGYFNHAIETADISERWSAQKTEADAAILGEGIEVSYGGSDALADDRLSEYLKWYRDGNAENLLVMPNNYSYWKVADALQPENAEEICYAAIRELGGSEFSVEASDYYDILMDEMVLMDLDESKTEYASERMFDNLEAFVDAEFEKEIMRKDTVERLASRSPGMETLRDDLNNVTTQIKNETETGYQWAECLAVFEVMAENYADFDNLLITISQNSDGELKAQADALQAAALTAMKIRLETYSGFQNATRSDYDVRWFNAIFFDAAKASENYSSDETFRNMIDDAERLFGVISIRKDLKQNVEAMTTLPEAELTSCMDTAAELTAQAQIDHILEQAVYTLIKDVQEGQGAGNLKQASGEAYIAYSRYLLFGRMHGEYLLHGLIRTDEDLREWFAAEAGADVVSWYDAKSSNLLNMRSDLLKAHESDLENYEGHSYLCVDSSKTWEEAKEFCESLGGHLACINSEGEQQFIESVIKDGEKHQYWLGGYATDDGYAWITGEEFDYTNWDADEPGGTGLTAGGQYIEILRVADPKRENSKAFGWKLAPANNTYEVEKPELITQAEEEAKKQAEADAAGEEQDTTDQTAQGTQEGAAQSADGQDTAQAAETPEQIAEKEAAAKALEEAQKQYKEDLEVVGFYGTDHIGFICEWDP